MSDDSLYLFQKSFFLRFPHVASIRQACKKILTINQKLLLHGQENLECLQVDFFIANSYNVGIARALEPFQRPLLFLHSVEQA